MLPIGGRGVAFEPTRRVLSRIGGVLKQENERILGLIEDGSVRSTDLDSDLVQFEQTKVQQVLDDVKESDPVAHGYAITQANNLLNPSPLQRTLIVADTDVAYVKVFDAVRADLGRDIDFSKQSDREAIGNKLIEHIRESGGCDVAGDRIAGC